MMQKFRQHIEACWYDKPRWLLLLWPLSQLFRGLAQMRRKRQQQLQAELGIPVVVIGNIVVGGTGKTPLLISLARQLLSAGLRPGIISRGYGAQAHTAAVQLVTQDSDSSQVGDEPLLLARAAQCPVAVSRDRVAAACLLRDGHNCNILLSDDGLQHYKLARDLEIAVVDATRGFGNGHCLPVGPLREPVSRLREVDWVVRNGNHPCAQLEPWAVVPMHLKPQAWVNVQSGARRELEDRSWLREPACAVAGIGNPQRFFDSLSELGLTVFPKPFPDHYAYTAQDFSGFSDEVIVMTAKDAVKCQAFAQENWWYLEVAAELPGSFRRAFTERVQALVSASETISE